MVIKFFGLFYIYVTRCRMKRRGKTDDVRRNRRSSMNRMKKRLFVSTGGTCAMCGRQFSIDCLQVHHIKPVSRFPRLIARKSNMLLLCAECHVEYHKRKEVYDG